jgi:patatin-like phospholipase/acyl hydrolase
MDKHCRILALDGGGLKGLFTAKLLADLESHLGVRIAEHFDLITGTSTGAIIALGLGLRVPTQDILRFYREKGPLIFDAPGYGLLKAKYSAEPLQKALTEVFGERTLGESQTALVVPAFNIQRREVKLFKTRHSSRLIKDHKMRAVDVAMASAAAPTYLPSFVDDSHIEYVDGGIWANNPALVGVIEAMSVLGYDKRDISVLSIGTTKEVFRMDSVKRDGGKFDWASKVSDIFIGADSSATDAMVEHLLRDDPDEDATRYVRINPEVAAGEFKLDKLSEGLIALGARTAEHASRNLRRKFFAEKARPFTPATLLYDELDAA